MTTKEIEKAAEEYATKLDVMTICHEACHFADFVAETVGFQQRSFDNGEAYAYLAGWCADCIDKARKFKNKKK